MKILALNETRKQFTTERLPQVIVAIVPVMVFLHIIRLDKSLPEIYLENRKHLIGISFALIQVLVGAVAYHIQRDFGQSVRLGFWIYAIAIIGTTASIFIDEVISLNSLRSKTWKKGWT